MAKDITICVLLYGDHYKLAERCLQSLQNLPQARVDLRVAMNAVCDATAWLVQKYQQQGRISVAQAHVTNIHKYPAMRALLSATQPMLAPRVMWFDDDSYLVDGCNAEWLDEVIGELRHYPMIGSIYHMKFQGRQREWIKAQPWYMGKDPGLRDSTRFCTGGWWAIQTKVLRDLGYPWANLDHNGGDVMLGEAMYQADLSLRSFRHGVHINADEIGRESKAPRRGFSQLPVGTETAPAVPEPIGPVVSTPARRTFLELDV